MNIIKNIKFVPFKKSMLYILLRYIDISNLYIPVVVIDGNIVDMLSSLSNDDDDENDYIHKCNNANKGKNKRSYESDDEDNEYSKKPKEDNYNYRDKDSVSSISETSSEEDVSNYLIVKRPELIENEIAELKKDQILIEEGITLANILPDKQERSNGRVLELIERGHKPYFNEQVSVIEGLNKLQKVISEELIASEKERARCRDTINAAVDGIRYWDKETVKVKVTEEYKEKVLDRSPDSD
jgi:hypothetical protein